MADPIVGEKEIATRLSVKDATVHQWRSRGLLPDAEGVVSGSPAWHWSTIERWAWSTGRMPHIRDAILALLNDSPTGGGFATPITTELVRRRVVGEGTNPARIASVLTDLLNEGLVSLWLRNEWKITDRGRDLVAARA
jgi:hypothetical protein